MARQQDEYDSIPTGDEVARRVAALYVHLSQSSQSVSSTELRREFYPGASTYDAFKHQFNRDRELLAQCGVVVRRIGIGRTESTWEIDPEQSFATLTVSPEDALVLDLICLRLVEDPSFPYRDELRLALAKIDREWGLSTPIGLSAQAPAPTPQLTTLLKCLSSHHGAAVTYEKASGEKVERTLALLGVFGLRDATYFVAAPIGADKALGEPHTYRLDRFLKVSERKSLRYSIPKDFELANYVLLPFQMGQTVTTATFSIPLSCANAVTSHTHGQGVFSSHPDGDGLLWEVPVSDIELAASWAVAEGITPVAPQELVEAWQSLIARAAAMEVVPW